MQGLFVGGTSYISQSLADIVSDIEKWKQYLSKTRSLVKDTIEFLLEKDYWTKEVPFNFRICCFAYVEYSKTINDDLSIIISDINNDNITNVTINLMKNIFNVVLENVNSLKSAFKEEYKWKQYGDALFEKAESLYGEIGDTLYTIFDISNMIVRVEMFMKKESNIKQIIEINKKGVHQYGFAI